MTEVRFSATARREFEEIACYTASHFGEAQRRRVLERFRDATRLLARHPYVGRERPEIREGVRSLVVLGRFLQLYRVASERVEIARVVPCSRALADELDDLAPTQD